MDDKDRMARHGQNLFAQAHAAGWKDDGEGPLEFLMRQAYVTGHDDARREAKGER